LSLESRALYKEWSAEANGEKLGFRESGLLMLYSTEAGREEAVEEAERASDAGLKVQILDREGLEEHTPHLLAAVTGGIYYSQDGMLTPARLIDTLEEELIQQDQATLWPDVSVTGFGRENGSIETIRTTNGAVEPENVVMAAGAWSAPLGQQLGLDVPIEPAKGYSVTFDVPDGRPDLPFLLTEEKVSVTPMGEQVRFAGTLELAGFDASVDPYRLAPILDVANEYALCDEPVSSGTVDPWVGFRPCTPDGLPIIGPVSQYDNLVMATGHCMLGISLAPITGRLVAEVLEHEALTVDLKPLRLQRFQ
jgi:D-amino-acid dehydrogenase